MKRTVKTTFELSSDDVKDACQMFIQQKMPGVQIDSVEPKMRKQSRGWAQPNTMRQCSWASP